MSIIQNPLNFYFYLLISYGFVLILGNMKWSIVMFLLLAEFFFNKYDMFNFEN